MTAKRFPLFAWGVFGYSMLVILWGYFLRISESGDGCGTDWPLCHGAVVPAAAEFPTWVEFIHRASSGLVLLLVLAMAIWAFRGFQRGHAVRKAAGAALLLTITESLFGAVLVVFGWVASDVSTARVLIRPFHVTNTFLLMAAPVLTAWWATRRTIRVPALRGRELRLVGPALAGVLALAWTGAWTGLATTAFPAETLREGMGQYLDPEHILIHLRMSHPVLAVGVVILVGKLALETHRRFEDSTLRTLSLGVGALAAVQLVSGPVTVLMMNPVWARLLHLFLADLLWMGLVLLGASLLSEARSEARPGVRSPAQQGATVPLPGVVSEGG